MFSSMASVQTKAEEPLGGRRARKKQRTSDMLAETAFSLFERDGFEGVTMEQIAAAADVSRGTLYNHFPVKEALLDHYFQTEFEAGIDSLIGNARRKASLENQLVHLFDAFSGWATRRRKYLPHCLDYGLKAGGRLQERPTSTGLRTVFTSLLAEAQKSGQIRPRVQVHALAEYLEFLYFAAILRWLASKDSSPRRECRRMLDLFLRGVQALPQVSRKARA